MTNLLVEDSAQSVTEIRSSLPRSSCLAELLSYILSKVLAVFQMQIVNNVKRIKLSKPAKLHSIHMLLHML